MHLLFFCVDMSSIKCKNLDSSRFCIYVSIRYIYIQIYGAVHVSLTFVVEDTIESIKQSVVHTVYVSSFQCLPTLFNFIERDCFLDTSLILSPTDMDYCCVQIASQCGGYCFGLSTRKSMYDIFDFSDLAEEVVVFISPFHHVVYLLMI